MKGTKVNKKNNKEREQTTSVFFNSCLNDIDEDASV